MARLTKTGDAMSDESKPDSVDSFDDDHDETSIFGNKLPSSPEAEEEQVEQPVEAAEPSHAPRHPEPKTTTTRSEPLTFMSFPREVRHQVYEHALIAAGSVYITSAPYEHDLLHWDDLKLRSSTGIYDYEQKAAIAAVITSNITPALVQVHPSLVTKAQDLLYGRNKFYIRGFLTVARFLTQIGSNRALLSNIEILEADDPEDVDGAIVQFVMGMLADAALNLKHLHFGLDVAAPFVVDPDDQTRFLLEKPARTKKMAKIVLPCIARIFRIRHRATGETATDFLNRVFSVHPTSFDPYGELPCDPFLQWDEEFHFTHWGNTLAFDDFLASADELRHQMRPLLEVEGKMKTRRHEQWNLAKGEEI